MRGHCANHDPTCLTQVESNTLNISDRFNLAVRPAKPLHGAELLGSAWNKLNKRCWYSNRPPNFRIKVEEEIACLASAGRRIVNLFGLWFKIRRVDLEFEIILVSFSHLQVDAWYYCEWVAIRIEQCLLNSFVSAKETRIAITWITAKGGSIGRNIPPSSINKLIYTFIEASYV